MTSRFHRILVVAPGDSGLDVIPEIDGLFGLGYAVQVVQGPVSRERLFRAIQSREFDGVHFAGHASADGFRLTAGDVLEPPSIVQLVKACHAEFVFLNGCETVEIGQLLVDEHVPAAICTLSRVDDNMAKETAQVFYRALAETDDLRSAYNASKPPVKGGYSLFTNGSTVTNELLAPVMTRLNEFAAIVEQNHAEHEAFRQHIEALTESCGNQQRMKRWMVGVFAATCAANALVTSLILVLDKAT